MHASFLRRTRILSYFFEMKNQCCSDGQYTSLVYDACRDAFGHLLGTARVAVAYQNEL
ncbi:PREDICTED: peroxisome biogenesis factor 10-like isoform 1 [Fragaria vesca subsp. vesca]